MPSSDSGSEDEEIDERREPTLWRDVADTINDKEDPMDDVFFSILSQESSGKTMSDVEEFQKGKFVDPLGILRMPPRTFVGKPQTIDDEHFDPVGQLAGLHISTNFSELVQGMRRLGRKLSSQEEDIKQLVRDNFDRFISCKDVIDGLYELISENEMSESGTGSRKVEQSCKEVLARAKRVYDPLLTRKAETDKIRQSLSILSRFSFLFNLPSKIAANIRDGEYDKAVQHYKKAASIFQDRTVSNISVFLQVFAEVENIVAGFRTTLYSALADPTSSFEAQERVIRILVDLARPSDFRLNPEKDPRDDPGWYYLNMAASRMISRLSNLDSSPTNPPISSAVITSPLLSDVPFLLSPVPSSAAHGGAAQSGAVYRSVRSACGHVARHFPNLWKMGQYYLAGRFDPRNYGVEDKNREEQAHPQQDKEKQLDKNSSVRIFFSDETSSVRVDSKKQCSEIVELCLRRVEGDNSVDHYAIFTWIEKRRKKDGVKVIKITELASYEKINKIHKKWGDKSGLSHKFLFKRKDEKFPKIHDPRTEVEDYTLEMRAASDISKRSKTEGKGGKKGEDDFHTLITSVLSVFAERVEDMFFHENSDVDDFDADMTVTEEQAEEWAFGKMRAQVLDVVTTLNVLQRAGMTEKYLLPVNQLVLKLCGYYVSRVCGQWCAEVALLYLSVPHSQNVVLDSSVGIPISSNVPNADAFSEDPTAHLPSMFAATTKFYLAQFKGIVSKGHPLLTQVQSAFGEALKCFADTLHHLAFVEQQDEEEDIQKVTSKIHNKLRIVSYILETRNMLVGSLWSHFNELFKLSSTHQVEEEVLSSSLEVMHHLGDMTVARYIHDRLTAFNKITRYGILLAPAHDWATAPIPTAVSEYAMSVLLHFVFVASELAILEPGSESYREHRLNFEKSDKDGLLEGTPTEVIGKLIGALVWGMMEGIRRNLKQLDGGSVSVSGVYQLRLDFCFLETILSRYIEEGSGITHAIHAQLAQMEEDAFQNGAGEDPIEVDLDAIIEDCARRSVVLFSALTGSAEVVSNPRMATARLHIPKRQVEMRSGRKAELSAELVIGNTRLADMMRRSTHAVERPQERAQERAQDRTPDRTPPNRTPDLRGRAETSPVSPSVSSKLGSSSNSMGGAKSSAKDREREKLDALRREREQRGQQKEQKEEKRERKEGASVLVGSAGSPSSSGGEREMTSREKALAARKEKERAKLNK